jgi:hypothetical protein
VARACGGNSVTATNSPRIRPRSAIATTSSSHAASRLVYNEAIREALIVIWETSDRICGKRRKPLIGLLAISVRPSTGVRGTQGASKGTASPPRASFSRSTAQCAGADLF